MRLGPKIFLVSALAIVALSSAVGWSLLTVKRLVSVNQEIATRSVPALRLQGDLRETLHGLVRLETRALVLADRDYARAWSERAARMTDELRRGRRVSRDAGGARRPRRGPGRLRRLSHPRRGGAAARRLRPLGRRAAPRGRTGAGRHPAGGDRARGHDHGHRDRARPLAGPGPRARDVDVAHGGRRAPDQPGADPRGQRVARVPDDALAAAAVRRHRGARERDVDRSPVGAGPRRDR